MSTRRTPLQPGTDRECDGCRVVYAASRSAVRSAVAERCGVVLLDAAMVRAQPAVLRWVVTMTTGTVVGVVGEVPEQLTALADIRLDAPLTPTAVETLVQRHDSRRAYIDAVERYYRAVADGADEPELTAARQGLRERDVTLDGADRRAVLDAIGV